jgi:ABC-2 type transport system permease protein/ribosome-dependent ATPase
MSAVAACEVRLLRRDPMLWLRALGVPVALFVFMAYGLSFDVEHIPLAVVDYDHSATSRDYVYGFAATRTFDLRAASASEREVETMLRRGQIRLAIIVPPGFERTLYRGFPAAVQLLVDGVYAYYAEVTRGYALAIHSRVAADLFAARLRERTGQQLDTAPIEIRTRYLYNETLQATNTIVPGLLPVVLMLTPAILMALAIVREKELGSIFNFLSSPVSRSEFILGKLLPYAMIGIGNAVLLAAIAVGLYHVPFKGSIVLYLLGSTLYVIATAAIGLVVSSFVRSQLAGIVVTSILTVVPALLYSGILVPVQSMTPDTRIVAELLPAMYYNRLVMAAFLKGLPLFSVVRDLGVLLLFDVVLLGTGIVLTRKREA